jgi:hypothetical protein
MVGMLPPHCLEALRLGKNDAEKLHPIFQDPGRTTTLRNSTGSCNQGLDVRNSSPSNARGEVFFLDISFYRSRKGKGFGKCPSQYLVDDV